MASICPAALNTWEAKEVAHEDVGAIGAPVFQPTRSGVFEQRFPRAKPRVEVRVEPEGLFRCQVLRYRESSEYDAGKVGVLRPRLGYTADLVVKIPLATAAGFM